MTSMAATPLIRIRGVGKRYGSVTALADVSLDIHHNEFFALLGPSGCGKTTLLRAIAGFEDPDEGSITLTTGDTQPADAGEVDLLALPPNRRPVNLMFQSYALFPHMTVSANIAYGLAREGLARSEIARRVANVLATVDLQDKASARPRQLSGGQRQRVALARAIVKRPKVLLLDEPLSALDRRVRADMQVELKRLQHEVGITFVVVTHDQEEAMSMADRIAVMEHGRISQIADPVTLYQRPVSAAVADFIGMSTIIPGQAAVDGFTALGERLPAAPSGVIGPALLVIRPEDVRLHADDPTDAAMGSLSGTVLATHFFGGTSTTTVTVAGLGRPVLATQIGPPAHRIGAVVRVGWPAERAIVLPDTP